MLMHARACLVPCEGSMYVLGGFSCLVALRAGGQMARVVDYIVFEIEMWEVRWRSILTTTLAETGPDGSSRGFYWATLIIGKNRLTVLGWHHVQSRQQQRRRAGSGSCLKRMNSSPRQGGQDGLQMKQCKCWNGSGVEDGRQGRTGVSDLIVRHGGESGALVTRRRAV